MEDIRTLNLEDTVGYLVDRAELASIGATLKGRVNNYSSLPVGEIGDVYAVGTAAPYNYYAYLGNDWLDIGVWPLIGPKGVPGDRGPQGPVGPTGAKGDKGNQGIAGPAGNGLGVNYITDLDLAHGDAAVTYDTTVGASLVKQGRIVAAGTSYDVTVDDEIPIIPGNNVTIDTTADGKHLKISAAGGTGSAMEIVTIGDGNTGTVTDTQIGLISNTATLCVVKSNNEIYWRMSDQHTPGVMGYSHLGYENGKFIQKNITFTISTRNWVKTTKDSTTVNGKSGAVNLVAGSNVTITEDGNNITISSAGGGGGGTGTDTGFSNVRRIEYADSQTNYDPDSGEYLNTTGTSTVYYKDNTSTTIPYVQTLGLMPGNNVTFTEEQVGNSWKVKVNATGGSSRPTLVLNTNDASPTTNNYGRTYYTWSNVGANIIDAVAAGEYDVTIYDQTSGGGRYYCPLTGTNMTWIGEKLPAGDTAPSELVGWAFKAKESTTALSFWRDQWSKSPPSGGKIYQHNIHTQCDPATEVFITVYTSNNTPLNSLTPWQNKFGYDKVYGGGYIMYSENYYPILYTQASGEGVKSYYKSDSSMSPGLTATYKWGGAGTWTDTVKEV